MEAAIGRWSERASPQTAGRQSAQKMAASALWALQRLPGPCAGTKSDSSRTSGLAAPLVRLSALRSRSDWCVSCASSEFPQMPRRASSMKRENHPSGILEQPYKTRLPTPESRRNATRQLQIFDVSLSPNHARASFRRSRRPTSAGCASC